MKKPTVKTMLIISYGIHIDIRMEEPADGPQRYPGFGSRHGVKHKSNKAKVTGIVWVPRTNKNKSHIYASLYSITRAIVLGLKKYLSIKILYC